MFFKSTHHVQILKKAIIKEHFFYELKARQKLFIVPVNTCTGSANSFREWRYGFINAQCVKEKNHITLCKINSMKKVK